MAGVSDWVHYLVRGSWVARYAAHSPAVWDFASNYVAGHEVGDAVAAAQVLRKQGLAVSFTYLADRESSVAAVDSLTSLLQGIADPAGVELSVRPSSLGMRDSLPMAVAQLRELAAVADSFGAHVTLEMQRPSEYDRTMELYRTIRHEYPMLGITLPVNLLRVETECRRLADDGARVRLCIGSYPAKRSVGLSSDHEKDLALVRCLRILMNSQAYPMLATHDPRVIEIAQELAYRTGRSSDSFEFQLLYGVRPLEQRRLADIGWTSRTYVPYGPGWYSYLATRIASRPRALVSYARALLDKR